MARKIPTLILLFSAALLFTHPATAFDGNRKGFLLGLGFGAHGSEIGPDSQGGLASSFKIGFGITNNLTLYYANHVAYFNADGYTYGSGITGVGMSFYFSPTRPSFYLTATVGLATIDDFGDVDDTFSSAVSGEGEGIAFGFGFELRRLLTLESMVLHSNIEYDGNLIGERDHTSVLLLANFIFY